MARFLLSTMLSLFFFLALLLAPSVLCQSTTTPPEFQDTLLSTFPMLPRHQAYIDYFGMIGDTVDLDSTLLSNGKTRLVASAQFLGELQVWQGQIYYMRSLGLFTYDWNNGLVMIRSIILGEASIVLSLFSSSLNFENFFFLEI